MQYQIFTEHYQIAASAATPSSLFSTGCVFPVKGKCAAWPSFWTCLFPASSFLCASKYGHRFLYNLLFRRAALLFASRSRFSLSTISVLLSTLHTFALASQSALIRSFPCSKTDRPSRTSGICRWQNCRSSSAAFSFFHHTLPASSTLGHRLPAPKPNLSGASSQDASTLLSSRSRRAGRSSVDTSGCFDESSVPASFLQQTFTDKRAPRIHRRGRSHRTRYSVLTRTTTNQTRTVLA